MKNPKYLRLFIVALLLAGVAAPATAGELSMIISGKSYHIGADYSWNEDNHGIGFEYDFTRRSRWIKSGVANAFRDSLENMSYMVGAGLRRRLFETDRLAGFYFDAGLVAFLMMREDVKQNQPFPGILPVIAAGNRHIGLNLTYIPKIVIHDMAHADRVDPNIRGVFFIQAKISLGMGHR